LGGKGCGSVESSDLGGSTTSSSAPGGGSGKFETGASVSGSVGSTGTWDLPGCPALEGSSAPGAMIGSGKGAGCVGAGVVSGDLGSGKGETG